MKQATALEVLKTGLNVFLTGEPGAGKTYTINMFTDYLKENHITYAVTASTGIAATHINGTTIHSWSGIGIKDKLTDADVDALLRKDYLVRQICNTKVLIIDEISMLNAQTLDNVERVISAFRGIMGNGEAFGGMQVVFVGDFYQLPPISRDEKAVFAFHAESWKRAAPVTCYLTEQHRQSDEKFLGILKRMRDGEVTEEDEEMLMDNTGKEKPKTKLFTHNKDVDALNAEELAKMKGTVQHFYMTSKQAHPSMTFLVETLKKNCLSPEKLSLKIGALVMFTRNNFDDGYVNGTLGTVVNFENDEPVVETKAGKRIHVKRARWSIGEGETEKASISQYPLRLAWAVTVHKSQGMSLDSACINLAKCFEYGQGYVAISRVCSLEGLYLVGMNPQALLMHPDVVEQDKVFRTSSDLMEEKF